MIMEGRAKRQHQPAIGGWGHIVLNDDNRKNKKKETYDKLQRFY